jgi:hypothetical protein
MYQERSPTWCRSTEDNLRNVDAEPIGYALP